MPIHGFIGLMPVDIWTAKNLNFYDEFNRQAVNPDIWTATLDAGGVWIVASVADYPTCWALVTDVNVDDDAGIIANGLDAKYFAPFEKGFTTVTFEARVQLVTITDISALLGLLATPPTDYAEPASDCAHFFMDPAITNTFRVRTYDTAEEETDTLVALDTDFHKLKMVLTRTSVIFYIDDVLVATHATRVPNQSLSIAALIRVEAGFAKHFRLDYIRVELS